MPPDADDEWLDPDDQMGLWEYQLQPLTVESLRSALVSLAVHLPVEVEFYDGSDARRLRPMHIDLKGRAGEASGFVITVVSVVPYSDGGVWAPSRSFQPVRPGS
ncbi:MAG: hypothetical protein ACR2HM_00440 [Acidimicrobiales bacterium]